jgi:hypothetical protein
MKHFIPSYSLRDMIFARFKHFLKNKREKDGRERTGPDLRDPGPELISFSASDWAGPHRALI